MTENEIATIMINFNVALIKDGIVRLVNRLKE